MKDRVLDTDTKRILPTAGVSPAVPLTVFDREDGAP